MDKIKKEKFLDSLKEALEVEDDETFTMDTNLKDLEEFDSLSVLVIVAMIDKKQISSSDFEKVTTVNSIISLIGEEYFG